MKVILFFTFLFTSILGCIYFSVSSASYYIVDVGTNEDGICDAISSDLDGSTWVSSDGMIVSEISDCPRGLFFVRSVYFMMQTLFTIGYGDDVVPSGRNMNEMVVACVFMLFGVFGYGLVIANMTSVLANMDVVSMRHRHEMDELAKWMAMRSVPEVLRERVNLFYHYMWRKQYGMLDEDLFHDLPIGLRTELSSLEVRLARYFFTFIPQTTNDNLLTTQQTPQQTNNKQKTTSSKVNLINKIPFFHSNIRSEYFLTCIANALVLRAYTPGSYLLFQFEKQRDLMIVKSGRADVYIKGTESAVSSLTPGDYIGDYQLLFDTINQVGVRTPDFTEVLVLTFLEFEKVCDNPDFSFLKFRELGGNFRGSDDPGALETIKTNLEKMSKLSAMISNVTSSKKSNKLKDMMQKTEVIVHGLMIYPNSKFHVYWDIVKLIVTFYYCLVIPVRLCWNLTGGGFDGGTTSGDLDMRNTWDNTILLDFLFDAVYIADIVGKLRFFAYTDYNSDRSEVVVDRERIWKHYTARPDFKIDLLISLPYDVFGAAGYSSLLRIPKILRITQLIRSVKRLQKHLEDAMQITMTETQVNIVVMIITTIILILWSSVGWNIARNVEEPATENFIFSTYWAFTTFTTVGYGDLHPYTQNQTLYALFTGMFGATFCAGIIANVTSFVHDVEVSEDNIEHKLNCLKWFLEGHNVSYTFVEKIQEYFDHVERDQEGINEDLLLSKTLPRQLRSDLMVHITSPMVLNCDFFKNCESGFIRQVMLSLEQRFFSTQFMIMTEDAPVDGMFFIKGGVVELLKNNNGTVVLTTRLSSDDSFAETCLLEYWTKNPFLAKAGTDCELWFLARSSFNRLVEDFPFVKKELIAFTHEAENSRRKSLTILDTQTVLLHHEMIAQTNSFFVNPEKAFIKIWYVVVFIFVMYNVIITPFRIAFGGNFKLDATIAFDYIGDVVFFMDVAIRSRFLGYFDDGHLIMNQKEISHHYFQTSWWKTHVLSIIPIDLIALFLSLESEKANQLQVWSLLRLGKCFRFLEIPSIMSKVENDILKMGIHVPKNFLRVSKLMAAILISAHWLGGAFYIIANNYSGEYSSNWLLTQREQRLEYKFGGNTTELDQFLANNTNYYNSTLSDTGELYTDSLYWAMATLTTVGYGDIHAENDREVMFSIFVLILGTGIYTMVIANLEDIVSQLDVTSSLYKRRVDTVKSYMGMFGFPPELREKILRYYTSCWRTQKGIKGSDLLGYMPRALRSELLLELMGHILPETFFIKDCGSDFVQSLVEKLALEIYVTGNTVFRTGEKANELFIIYSGEVDLLTASLVKFKTVRDCTLGDSGFFRREQHICDARASKTSEIFVLAFEDFWVTLHDAQMTDNFSAYLDENHSVLNKFKEQVEKLQMNLKSSKMAKMMDVQEENVLARGIILPDSKFRRIWLGLALAITVYNLCLVPLRIASFGANEARIGYLLLDLLFDAFFYCDIRANMKNFAIMRDGFLITDRVEFEIIYKQNYFLVDLVTCLPLRCVCEARVKR